MDPATDQNITLIVSAIVGTGMVLLIAPRVLAKNKGKILRNIALWVGILLLLVLTYKTVGPGKNQPILNNEIVEDVTAIQTSPEDDGIMTIK